MLLGMKIQRKSKAYPLSMRLPSTDIAIIDRAAHLRGRSRTDFVRDAAVRAAEEVLMEDTLLPMSPKDFRAFVTAVEAPGTVVPEMVEMAKRKAPWSRARKRR
jgi:uncharacterized protein (DUF1778 family)